MGRHFSSLRLRGPNWIDLISWRNEWKNWSCFDSNKYILLVQKYQRIWLDFFDWMAPEFFSIFTDFELKRFLYWWEGDESVISEQEEGAAESSKVGSKSVTKLTTSSSSELVMMYWVNLREIWKLHLDHLQKYHFLIKWNFKFSLSNIEINLSTDETISAGKDRNSLQKRLMVSRKWG